MSFGQVTVSGVDVRYVIKASLTPNGIEISTEAFNEKGRFTKSAASEALQKAASDLPKEMKRALVRVGQ
jgi:hypothetical protein